MRAQHPRYSGSWSAPINPTSTATKHTIVLDQPEREKHVYLTRAYTKPETMPSTKAGTSKVLDGVESRAASRDLHPRRRRARALGLPAPHQDWQDWQLHPKGGTTRNGPSEIVVDRVRVRGGSAKPSYNWAASTCPRFDKSPAKPFSLRHQSHMDRLILPFTWAINRSRPYDSPMDMEPSIPRRSSRA
jgi:hypothetical protein